MQISSFLLDDNVVEFFEAEIVVGFSVIHDVGVVHHLCELVIVQGLAEFSGDSFEAFEISIAVVFVVPDLENSRDAIS